MFLRNHILLVLAMNYEQGCEEQTNDREFLEPRGFLKRCAVLLRTVREVWWSPSPGHSPCSTGGPSVRWRRSQPSWGGGSSFALTRRLDWWRGWSRFLPPSGGRWLLWAIRQLCVDRWVEWGRYRVRLVQWCLDIVVFCLFFFFWLFDWFLVAVFCLCFFVVVFFLNNFLGGACFSSHMFLLVVSCDFMLFAKISALQIIQLSGVVIRWNR